MLLSIENARKTLPNSWLAFSGFNAMAMGVFLAPMFNDLPITQILVAMSIAACAGFVLSIALTFRSQCGTTTALLGVFYFLISMEFLFAGGATALVPGVTGRPDLCWLVFCGHVIFMILSLLGGIYREAKALEWWGAKSPEIWKSKLEKHIDYSKHQIIPGSATAPTTKSDKWTRFGPLIIMAGPANIMLIFEFYGGGRNNAIWMAAPILAGIFSYFNLKQIGPAFFRLLLLRNLEREAGRRFLNADYEQIQKLRRTFFLSRWLMKDYVGKENTVSVLPVLKKKTKKK